ncbi:hypothetical protein FP2506_01155 [Fulvimarina pelagi HTCC2506]|uniref:TniQ domain-containing protein n=1 Tax=Fulvimarina pelagi HTCC2506 TaxID=314231 RepID=Q0G266_9HYPH|nr:TniQ family protein [Fulvimarina pelagi]EAU41332.1 hypothetical protein FP2506_01155 [Fulvimarina pelagi HTCC2506]
MRGTLPVRPPIGASETPVAYASRLARANGFDSIWGFAGFFGMDPHRLRAGRLDDLKGLSRLSGVALPRLESMAGRFLRDGRMRFGDEIVTMQGIRSTTIAFCPACIAEDLRSCEVLEEIERPWQRLEWRFRAITACGTHDARLEEHRIPPRFQTGDFTGALDWCRSTGLVPRKAQPAVFTRRQAYLAGRLRGETVTAGAFVDGLAWYAAARMFECVGTADLAPGMIRFRKNDILDDMGAVADRGFEILSDGEKAFAKWITDRIERSRTKETGAGWPASRSIFGDLADTLERTPDPEYVRIRAMIVEASLDRLPLAAGSTFLGTEVVMRRYHSLRSASSDAGLTAKRMTEILHEASLLPANASTLAPERILLPAGPVDTLIKNLRNLVPAAEIARIFGLPESQTRTAVELTCLTRMACPDGRIPDGAFDRRDVLALKKRLLAGAEAVDRMTDDRITLEGCLRHFHVRFADLVAMVESGRVGWRGLLRGSKDLRGLVFDREEMRRLTAKAEDGGLSLVEAMAYSGFHKTVLNHFVATGILARPEAVNPHNGRKVSAFRTADLDALRTQFVTLTALADEMNTEKAKLWKEIAAAGIAKFPEDVPVRQVVYRRSDVNAWTGSTCAF